MKIAIMNEIRSKIQIRRMTIHDARRGPWCTADGTTKRRQDLVLLLLFLVLLLFVLLLIFLFLLPL
jgi:hypothetical protein